MTHRSTPITDAGADPVEGARPTVRRSVRISGLAGIVGPVAFVLGFTAAGSPRPGYSALRHPVSGLGTGQAHGSRRQQPGRSRAPYARCRVHRAGHGGTAMSTAP